MKKRGISPLIATVLLIGTVIILAVVVLQQGSSFIQTTTEETSEDVEYELEIAYFSFDVLSAKESIDTIYLQIENNNEEAITGFKILVEGPNGIENVQENQRIEAFNTQTIEFTYDILTTGLVNKITVLPTIEYQGQSTIVTNVEEEITNIEEYFTDVVLSLSFDEGSGDMAYDNSEYENDGSLKEGPTWTTDCKSGSCLEFDGVDDYVKVPDSEELSVTEDLTIEAWIYRNDYISGVDRHTIISKDVQYEFDLVAEWDDSYGFYHGNGNDLDGYWSIVSNGAPAGEWIHIVLVRDHTSKTFNGYKNGFLENSLDYKNPSNPIADGPYSVNIGRRQDYNSNPNQYFDGRIDEVKIYNRALEQEEVEALYLHY